MMYHGGDHDAAFPASSNYTPSCSASCQSTLAVL